jgi:hypothetical protein
VIPSPHAPWIDAAIERLIPPLRPEERAQLEESIRKYGCRDSIVISAATGAILDGHHRYRICIAHGIEFSVCTVDLVDDDATKAWVRRNALARRNLSDDQRAVLAFAEYDAAISAGNVARAVRGAEVRWGNECSEAHASSKHQPKDRARTRFAKGAGVSDKKLRFVIEIARADPAALGSILRGELTVYEVRRDLAQAEHRRGLDDLAAQTVKEARGVYDVSVLDPPAASPGRESGRMTFSRATDSGTHSTTCGGGSSRPLAA